MLRRALTIVALGAAIAPAAAVAAPSDSRLVVATRRDGVRLIADLRVGPLGASAAASTLAEVRALWGRELRLRRCVASWGTGVRLLFTTFGGPAPCSKRFLQVVTVTGRAWRVQIRGTVYEMGTPKSDLPTGAKRIRGWNGGGYELATMPFIGSHTTTVMAHLNHRDRIDRFVLFIGGAGD
jgi:hypothetical protein